MKKWFALIIGFASLLGTVAADDEVPKGDKVTFEVFTRPYFEKYNTGLKGDASFLVLEKQSDFDKMFGVGVTMGKKFKFIPKDAFEKNMVVSVIKRGNAITTYEVESVSKIKDHLVVQYKTTSQGGGGTAKYASPLLLLVEKGKYTSVDFYENGKKIGSKNLAD